MKQPLIILLLFFIVCASNALSYTTIDIQGQEVNQPASIDSLTNCIEKTYRKEIQKLVKSLYKAHSSEEQNHCWVNIHQYFFHVQNQQLSNETFACSIQYFLTLGETKKYLRVFQKEQIKTFIDTANEYINEQVIQDFILLIPQIENYSISWNSMLQLEKYPWIHIDKKSKKFKEYVYQPIIQYYFKQLQSKRSYLEQNLVVLSIEDKFPNFVDSKVNAIDLILSTYHSDEKEKLTLYNHSYLDYYLDNVQRFDWWLIRDNPDFSIDILASGITKESITILMGEPIEIVTGYRNDKLSYQLKISKDDTIGSGNAESIFIFENGQKTQETYFFYDQHGARNYKSYSFLFSKNENVTLKGIEDTLQLAQKLSDEKLFDSALVLLSGLKQYDFPDTLSVFIKIHSIENEINTRKQVYNSNRLGALLSEIEILLEDNNYQLAQNKINEAFIICPLESPLYLQLDKKQIELEQKLARRKN